MKKVVLPNILENETQEIYMNGTQLRFMDLKQKHVLLRGAYGTGKSILAQLKFEEFMLSEKQDRWLYFICWSGQTILEEVIKTKVRKFNLF